jgi:putative Ca2+/H+ antiporter (TMEM165/GDT1 family)
MVQDILIPLIVVGLAELGDKTQLSTLLLASKTEKHLHLFLGLGLLTLIFRTKMEETKSKYHFENPFYSGFILIFVSEWGDKTQIAAGLFATKYSGLMVLTGVIMALSLLSIIAIYSGKFISDKVNRETVAKIAGISFILMGVAFFF